MKKKVQINACVTLKLLKMEDQKKKKEKLIRKKTKKV